MDAFYTLKNWGLKLNFILAHVPETERVNENGITYINGRSITYRENLVNVRNTKCLLEVIQKESKGYTLRTLEAIAYGKRLISNNDSLLTAPFYNPDFIEMVSSFKDISSSFIERIKNVNEVDYNYISELSPIKLLEFIEKKISDI